jgi:dihydroorotase
MGLLDLLARLTCGPAAILGLAAGRLARGAAADLTLLDLGQTWRIDPDAFVGKSKNSPFDDHPVQGHVLRTLVDGRTVFQAEA